MKDGDIPTEVSLEFDLSSLRSIEQTMSFEDVLGSEGGVPGEKPQTTAQ